MAIAVDRGRAGGSSHTVTSVGRVIFITGTDTGVGKTVLTALLLYHLRQRGTNALAMKPFCCGDRADVRLVQALQQHHVPTANMNPFYFSEPLAPLVAARKHRRRIRLRHVVESIRRLARVCDCLIVEGCGGVMVPLGKNYTVADLIKKLQCEVVVVARNQLGTINHTLLTVGHLVASGQRAIKVVLMGQKEPDLSARSNERLLRELLAPVAVFNVKFCYFKSLDISDLKNICRKVKKTLAQVVE